MNASTPMGFTADTAHFFERGGVQDAQPTPALERLLRLSTLGEALPMAFISLTHETGPSIVASLNLEGLEISALFPFLHRVVHTGKALVLPNLRQDPAFADLPCVQDGRCGFYAGVPLVVGGTLTLGTLSVMDKTARTFPSKALQTLEDLAHVAVEALEQQITRQELLRLAHEHEQASAILRSVLNTAASAIVRIDQQGQILAFNPAAERLFGYRFEEVRGQNIRMLMPDPWASQHDRYMARYCAGNAPKIIGIGREVKGLRKDRSVFPMHLGVSEIRVREERQFTGIVTDLSAVYTVRDDLAREKALFRAVLNSADNPLYACDLEGRYLFANQACQQLLGLAPEQLIGRLPEALFDEETAVRIHHTNAEVIATQREIRRTMVVGERRFHLKKSPLMSEKESIIGVVSTAYDITAASQ